MSINASLDIRLYSKGNYVISSAQIIQAFINSGWNIQQKEKILYLPFGDHDDYDWQEKILSKDAFFELIEKKEEANEVIGVGLFWDDTGIGGTLLLLSNESISFSITINRKILLNNITDVNWYLERIFPCLETDALGIEHFTFSQV